MTLQKQDGRGFGHAVRPRRTRSALSATVAPGAKGELNPGSTPSSMGAQVGYGGYLVVVRDAPASGSASTPKAPFEFRGSPGEAIDGTDANGEPLAP